MKIWHLLIIFMASTGNAQLLIRPAVGQQDFRLWFNKGRYTYAGKGSSSWSPVLDFEYRKRISVDSSSSEQILATNPSLAVVAGLSYWRPDLQEWGTSLTSEYLTSSYQAKFIALYLMPKGYWQLGVLNENIRIGAGLGLLILYRLETKLAESATFYNRDNNGFIISSYTLSDQRDVTMESHRFSPNWCLELTVEIGRIYMAMRAFRSLQDEYIKSLAGQWNVPHDQSIWLLAHDKFPGVLYTGGTFMIGFNLVRTHR